MGYRIQGQDNKTRMIMQDLSSWTRQFCPADEMKCSEGYILSIPYPSQAHGDKNYKIYTINPIMHIFYEVMKWFFFFATLLVGIVFLRGELIRWSVQYATIKSIIVPWYLVFCGIIIWYIIAYMFGSNPETMHKRYVTSFVIGISIGIVLAIGYMFM